MNSLKRVAVVGLGSIAERHRSNLRLLFPGARIFAMSTRGQTPDLDTISNCDLVVGSIDELISFSPEFSIVASPAPYHKTHAISLIEAGIPVLIEKPMSSCYEDACELLRVSEEHDVQAAIGYCLRYLPSAQVVKKMIENKELGEVYNVFINTGQYLPNWRKDKSYKESVSANRKLGGGVLLELSHELDYVHWIFGKIDLVNAVLRSSKKLDLDVEDIADLVFEQESGTVLQIHLDFLQEVAQRLCIILTEKGRLEWDLIQNTVIFISEHETKTVYSDSGWDKNIMYLDMTRAFFECDFTNLASIADGTEIMSIIDQIKLLDGKGVS